MKPVLVVAAIVLAAAAAWAYFGASSRGTGESADEAPACCTQAPSRSALLQAK
jgi:hypothetical protein